MHQDRKNSKCLKDYRYLNKHLITNKIINKNMGIELTYLINHYSNNNKYNNISSNYKQIIMSKLRNILIRKTNIKYLNHYFKTVQTKMNMNMKMIKNHKKSRSN